MPIPQSSWSIFRMSYRDHVFRRRSSLALHLRLKTVLRHCLSFHFEMIARPLLLPLLELSTTLDLGVRGRSFGLFLLSIRRLRSRPYRLAQIDPKETTSSPDTQKEIRES